MYPPLPLPQCCCKHCLRDDLMRKNQHCTGGGGGGHKKVYELISTIVGGKCGNGREAVRRKSVANPLQTNYFATSLQACKFNANTKFASDLHIRKSVDYIKLANGL